MHENIYFPLIGFVVVFLLSIRESNKFLLISISGLALVVMLMPALFYYFRLEVNAVYALPSLGFITCYVIRFVKKQNRGLIEYQKLSVAVAFAAYPGMFWLRDGETLQVLTASLVLAVYVYDRIVLRAGATRKFILIQVVQTVLIITFLVYALVQRTEAIRNVEIAEEQTQQAMQMAAQTQKLHAQLDSCRSSK